MKKKYIALFVALCATLQSCYKEENDLFSQSASDRLTEATIKYNNILTSAKDGWLLKYYPGGSNQSYGGFNMILKFRSGKASVATDIVTNDNAWTSASSLYQVKMEEGPVLSFDSYNPVLNYFTEPVGGNASRQGDFEFIIMSATENEVVLQGKKYGTIMHMTRLSDDFDQTAFAHNITVMQNSKYWKDYSITDGGKEIGKAEMSTENTFTVTQGDNVQECPYIYTEKGIELYDSVKIGNTYVKEFNLSSSDNNFTSGNIKMTGLQDPDYEANLGSYTFQVSDTKTLNVSLGINQYGRNYVMNGYVLTSQQLPLKIGIVYDDATGDLILPGQALYNDGTNMIFLCPWDSESGYLTWSTSVNIRAQKDPKNPGVYTFKDVKSWSYPVNGFLISLFQGGSYAGSFEQWTGPFILKKK